ncbi:MAG: AI-2E family transporter [Lachnoclostridium sp.]|nr:AI-2E family transporter [Lachnospira sp.]MCM1247003.1 AI-2E family transporter [Lachnoclostridium sp.]
MVEKIKDNKPILLLLITGAVYLFLQFIAPLLTPVLVAMLFVTIFGPTLQKLKNKLHIHRQIGAVILMLIAGTVVILLVWILFSWLVGSLPEWTEQLDVLEEEIEYILYEICESVGNFLNMDSLFLKDTILLQFQKGMDYFQTQLLPGMLSQSLEYVKTVGATAAFLVTFIIAVVLLAKDYDSIMNQLLDREEYHVLLEIICGMIRYIATYVKAQLIIMSAIGSIAALTLGIAGIRHGAIWGVVAGILDALPFVGTGIVLVPLCVTQLFGGHYTLAVVCIILYVACIFLRELLEPRLIGKKIGVPPIAVLISLYAGIRLFGIWGIIKGPLGFIIIYQAYKSILRRREQKWFETEK